jgi:hypothetical protein
MLPSIPECCERLAASCVEEQRMMADDVPGFGAFDAGPGVIDIGSRAALSLARLWSKPSLDAGTRHKA